jgi:uncharacterized membrane protein SpoIIM required for sporulation
VGKINPFKKIISGTVNDNIFKRIGWLYVSFFLIFISVTILSYFLLPDAFLRGQHPIVSRLEFSPDLWLLALQIFGYNLIPTSLIVGANLIAQKYRISNNKFVPVGYIAFLSIITIAALYLGTWSFEVVTEAPPLYLRLLTTLDVFHRSGFLELSAYLLAAAVSFKFTLWHSDGKKIIKSKKIKDIRLATSEKIIFTFVFILLFCSAFIESYRIVQLARL